MSATFHAAVLVSVPGIHYLTDFGELEVAWHGDRAAALRFVGRDKLYYVRCDRDGQLQDEAAFLGMLDAEWSRVGPAGIGRADAAV
jgi:hypothetical protein